MSEQEIKLKCLEIAKDVATLNQYGDAEKSIIDLAEKLYNFCKVSA